MGDRGAAPEEVIVLQPEPVGSAGEGGPARIDLGPEAFASRIEVEVDVPAQGLAPIVRAAETVLRQGKRYIVLDLSGFESLKPEEAKTLAEARERCARAHGMLLVYGLRKGAEEALKSVAGELVFDATSAEKDALDRVRERIIERRDHERRVGDLEIDTHVLPLGKKHGDESFVDGYRRKGPEGVTRELVVIQLDEKGATKVAEKVRQLSDKKLGAFIVDLSQVSALDGTGIKEIIRARKIAEDKGAYFVLAGAKDAVAGLLKVMNLERDVPSHPTVEKAVEDFKEYLLDHIEAAETKSRVSRTGERKAAAAAPAPRPAASAPAPEPATARAESAPPPPPAPAKPREKRLELEVSGDELFFYMKGKKPAKKDLAGDAQVLALVASEETASGLAAEVRRAVGSGTNRILVDVAALGGAEDAVAALREAQTAANEKKARLVFHGAAPELRAKATGLEFCDDETHAAEEIALDLIGQKKKKGVKLRRVRGKLEAKPGAAAKSTAERKAAEARPRTQMIAAPDFDEERSEAKTALFQVPSFEETEGKTKEIAVPTFDEDEPPEKPGRTQMVAVPDFADEKGSDPKPKKGEERPKTQVMPASPVEEARPGKTQVLAVPDFGSDEPERKEGKLAKTQMIAAPQFDGEEKHEATQSVAAPDFAEGAKKDAKRAKTQVVGAPQFDDEEKHESTQAVGAPDFVDRKNQKTQMIAPPRFEDEEEPKRGKTQMLGVPDFAAEEKKPAKTQMIAAPKFDDVEEKPPAKTQMIAAPTFLDEKPGKAAAKPEPQAPAKPEPAKAETAKPSPASKEDMRVAKTEAMPGLTREEAMRLAQAAVGGPPAPTKAEKAPPAPPKPTPPPKAPEPSKGDIRVAKTEAMPGLTREEAMKLAQAALEPPSSDLRGKKTEVIPAAPAKPTSTGEMRVAKTEAMPGLTREEAVRLVQGTQEAKTGEMKAAKIDAAPAKQTASKVAVKKTGEVATPPAAGQPSKGEAKTVERKAVAKTAQVATPDADVQRAKTEVMPGMSRADAEKQVAMQSAKTDSMAGVSREHAEMQVAKTQVMGGMSQAEARRQMASESGGEEPAGEEAVAETRRSPMPFILAAVALLLVAVLAWKGPEWFGSGAKPDTTSTAGGGTTTGGKTPPGPTPEQAAAERQKAIEEAVRAIRAASEEAIETE